MGERRAGGNDGTAHLAARDNGRGRWCRSRSRACNADTTGNNATTPSTEPSTC